jgi:hypothetical protein
MKILLILSNKNIKNESNPKKLPDVSVKNISG